MMNMQMHAVYALYDHRLVQHRACRTVLSIDHGPFYIAVWNIMYLPGLCINAVTIDANKCASLSMHTSGCYNLQLPYHVFFCMVTATALGSHLNERCHYFHPFSGLIIDANTRRVWSKLCMLVFLPIAISGS